MPWAPAPGGLAAEQMNVPGMPGAVGVEGHSGSGEQLQARVGAGDDVAADVVRVVGGERRRRPDGGGDDALAEAGGEPLDLLQDRLGGVTGVAVRHVGVDPERVDPTG